MAGRIPKSFIDDLIARSNIVDLIDSRVKLKKSGTNYVACCPFHNEKSPSFNVSESKQFYHCFGCGVSGSVISFLMAYERLDFVEAVEELAAFHGLSVPREQVEFINKNTTTQLSHQSKQDYFQLMDQVCRFFQKQLREPQGQVAVAYLKKRGISGEIAKKYRIGYISDQWEQLKQTFATNELLRKDLVELGMLIEAEQGRCYDRFRGRVMIPILNRQGNVIGFGGRTLGDETPKYLNSPETQLFHKGKELFGLYELLQNEKNPECILVVEGYMDVIALAQYGIDYAVASLGTATTKEQLQLLFRQTSTVVCCYDGDKAGKEAAWKALKQAIPLLTDKLKLEFMFLPDGEDPDSFIRSQGKEAFQLQQKQALSLTTFFFTRLLEKSGSDSKEAIMTIVPEAAELINLMPNGALRFSLRQALGKRVQITDDRQLEQLIRELKDESRQKKATTKRTPMREVVALLVQHPEFVQHVPDLDNFAEAISIPGFDFFIHLITHCKQYVSVDNTYTTAQLLESYRETSQYALVNRLACLEIHEGDDAAVLFIDALDKILAQCVNEQINKLQAKSANIGLTFQEKQALQQLLMDGHYSTNQLK